MNDHKLTHGPLAIAVTCALGITCFTPRTHAGSVTPGIEHLNIIPELTLADALASLIRTGIVDRATVKNNLRLYSNELSKLIAVADHATLTVEHKAAFLSSALSRSRSSLDRQTKYIPNTLLKGMRSRMSRMDALLDAYDFEAISAEAAAVQNQIKEIELKING